VLTPFFIRLAELAVVALLALTIFFAWRADRRDRAQLASELAATRQILASADARQHDRDTQLAQTLAALTAEKRTITTPAQIVHDLPSQISLPSPIVLQTPSPAAPNANVPNAPAPQASAVIPAQDLKPLYDFTIDCKTCQAKLATAQNDLLDEQKKTAALTKERDDALRIAKGGSPWRRVARAAKWLLIGAAAGAIAAKSAH
jgi:type II secretory pathway pseudopilin PulG